MSDFLYSCFFFWNLMNHLSDLQLLLWLSVWNVSQKKGPVLTRHSDILTECPEVKSWELQEAFSRASAAPLDKQQMFFLKPSFHFTITVWIQTISSLPLTISIYVNPVKHTVGEILCWSFIIFISIDGTNGLQEEKTQNGVTVDIQRDHRFWCFERQNAPLWCWGARVCQCSHFHPHRTVWNTTAACAPSSLASPGSGLPHTPWSRCNRPAGETTEPSEQYPESSMYRALIWSFRLQGRISPSYLSSSV